MPRVCIWAVPPAQLQPVTFPLTPPTNAIDPTGACPATARPSPAKHVARATHNSAAQAAEAPWPPLRPRLRSAPPELAMQPTAAADTAAWAASPLTTPQSLTPPPPHQARCPSLGGCQGLRCKWGRGRGGTAAARQVARCSPRRGAAAGVGMSRQNAPDTGHALRCSRRYGQ